jgi:hypothetical protein
MMKEFTDKFFEVLPEGFASIMLVNLLWYYSLANASNGFVFSMSVNHYGEYWLEVIMFCVMLAFCVYSFWKKLTSEKDVRS